MARTQRTALIVLVVLVVVAAGSVGAVLGLQKSDQHTGPARTPSAGSGRASSGSATPQPPSSPQSSSAGTPKGATTPPDPDLARFYSQQLTWSSCRSHDECAKLEVPLDYAHPGAKTIKLALLRVPASDASARLGSLVVNPGGPGAPGTDYAASGSFGRALQQHYDIVGFDPRGTGGSAPVDCLSDSDLDKYVATDPDPETPAEVKTYSSWVTRMGEGCATKSPDLAAHVSTVEAARDMDILRAALGEQQLDYLGASYGTKLGSTYADLFPPRVGRFVLDGALDPKVGTREVNLAQAAGFEVELRAYVKHCVEQGDCFLGDSVDAGVTKIQQILADIDDHPIPVGSRELTGGLALFGVITPLYDRSYWSYLDQSLKGALRGDGTMLLAWADIYSDRGPSGFKDNSVEANWAINCLDDPTSASPAQIKKEIPTFEKASPTFGASVAWMMGGCASEKFKAAEKPPPVGAPGANPIVVVGTTRDPATPYAWAKSLAKELDSGVLVTRDGDGHTGYNQGNSCVNDAVEGYLVDGTVPQDGLRC